METINKTQNERITGRRIALRVLAALLALVLLFSVVVSILVRVVKPRQKTVSLDLVEEAFSSIAADDDYLNAPVVERIGRLFSTIGVTPNTISDYEQLASLYIGRGNYEEARYLYEQAAALIPVEQEVTLANMYYKLGSVSVLCGDLAAAEHYYGRVLDYGVSSELIHVLMAQVYLEQGKYDEAVKQLALYLLYAPDDVENRRLYANVLEVSGNAAAAQEQYQLLFDLSPDASGHLDVARAALQAGDYQTAVTRLSQYLETNADTDGSLHAMRGMAALWMGDHQMAIADMTEAERLGYEDADGSQHYMRGIAHLSAEEYEKADADLLEAIERGYADVSECYSQLSLSAYLRGDYKTTLQYGLLSCESTDAPDTSCLQRMGLSHMQLEQYDAALAYLEQSLAADPALAINHYFIATLYFVKEQYEDAAASYTQAIDGDVYTQECLYNRALCYLQLRRNDEAIADLLASLDMNEDEEITAAAKDILSQLGVSLP